MVYFMRHSESQTNVEKIYAGQRIDTPLTAKGSQQSHQVATDIQARAIKINHIVTSPLRRTAGTAAIVAHDLGLTAENISIDPRLTEYDIGSLTGQPMVPANVEIPPPADAENLGLFQQRVVAAVNDAAQLPGNVLLVSHGGVGKMLEATAHGQLPQTLHDLDSFPHSQIIELHPPFKLAA